MSSRIDSSHRERQGRALRNRNRPRKKIPVRPPLPSDAEGAAKLTSSEAAVEKRKRPWLLWLLVLVQAALLAAVVWLIRLLKRGKEKLGDDVLPKAKDRIGEAIRKKQRKHWEKKHPGET